MPPLSKLVLSLELPILVIFSSRGLGFYFVDFLVLYRIISADEGRIRRLNEVAVLDGGVTSSLILPAKR